LSPLSPRSRLGIPASVTFPPLQTAAFKELVNKLAWALGTTYRVSYASARADSRRLATELAGELIKSEGFPAHIGMPPS